MRGDWKCAEEQEHDKLLNDDHSVCVSMTVCTCVRCIFVCMCVCACLSLEPLHSQAEHNQRSSHLQSVIRMLISPWELTGTSVLQGLD